MVDISRGWNGGFRREKEREGREQERKEKDEDENSKAGWSGDFIGGVNASPARILIKSNSRLRKLATGSTVK